MKEEINNMNLINTAKDTVKKIKRQVTGREKTSAKHIPNKEIVSKIYKNLLNLNIKEITA
jgi:hypothetical protein